MIGLFFLCILSFNGRPLNDRWKQEYYNFDTFETVIWNVYKKLILAQNIDNG